MLNEMKSPSASARHKRAGASGGKKIILMYSGGLDTSVILKWLQQNYKAEVITLTLDPIIVKK